MSQQPVTTESFLKAYDELSDALFRHCLYRVYDRERAKDLCQEAFMRTWEQVAAGKDIRNLKAFLYRVTNNLVIDDARKKKEASLEAIMESGFEPMGDAGTAAPNAAELSIVMGVLKEMEPEVRDVIVMRFLDGFGPKEIAEVTGESENVISVRLHRGLKRVRAAVENGDDNA